VSVRVISFSLIPIQASIYTWGMERPT
jgi:hypothetical protein